MLKLFEVTGFKNFHKPIKIDFTDVRDYKFNSNCVTNGFISKMIIYGKNAIGKTNFGRALMDITTITRLQRVRFVAAFEEDTYDVSYLNTNNNNDYAEFRYVFRFDDQEIEYIYRKNKLQSLVYERVSINDLLLFDYDREFPEKCDIDGIKKISPTLNTSFENVESVLAYVVSNTPLDAEHPLRKMFIFIGSMKFNISPYDRIRTARGFLPVILSEPEILREFEDLLHASGINDNLLILKDNDGKERLYFDKSPPLLFERVASSGTKTLLDFFVAYKRVESGFASLLFLDEFDAFYHFELAENIVLMLTKMKNTQVIFTSHNTNLLSNRIMRPDCYYILTTDKLTSFANATTRELREGHNLEKLFMSGEFDEQA